MVQRILNNWFVKWVLAPVAVLCALGWGYFQINYPTCTFRYKLTAEVMTPEGVKTGSSVIEVSYSSTGGPIGDWSAWRNDKVTGEAAAIDLGQGEKLFLLLGRNASGRPMKNWSLPSGGSGINEPSDYTKMDGALGPLWLPIKYYELGRKPSTESEMCHRAKQYFDNKPRKVDLNNLPTMISFKDLNEPLSAQLVDPNDLATTFGPGYALRTAEIEFTTEQSEPKIKQILPWLNLPVTGLLNSMQPNYASVVQILRPNHFYMDHDTSSDGF